MTDDPIVGEYSRLASRYDTRWSAYVRDSARETLARLPILDPNAILDVGCGTGVLLGELRQRFPRARLVGVDATPAMLEVARRRLGPAVDLREARADALPYADRSFDLVVCASVLHFLPDPEVSLREWARVLCGGGTLAITDWSGDYLLNRLRDRYLRLLSRGHAKVHREADLARMLRAVGYLVDRSERYKISWSWGLMTVVATKPAPTARQE